MAVTLSSSTVTQLILVDASSGATTVDLKTTGTRCPDVLHVIKKIDSSTNAVTIQDSGGSQIEGQSTFVLVKQNDSVTLSLDGNTNSWRVISNNSGISSGYIPYASGGLLANSPVYVSGSYVGVNTASPNNIFDVKTGSSPGYGNYFQIRTYSATAYQGGLLITNSPATIAGYTSLKITSTFNSSTSARARLGFVANSDTETFLNSGPAIDMLYNGNVTLVWGTGNLLVGNGLDNGNKLQVNGSAWINGSFHSPIKTVTSAYTLTSSDSTVLANASSAAFTVTLPDATTCNGREYVIKKIDSSTNAVTVGVTGTQTIDGASSYSLALQNKYVAVQSNGSNWYIIANN
jgi:hypothetical protein